MQALLNKQPMRRPNCEQLLEHPFLAVTDQQDAQKAKAEQRSSSSSRAQQQSAAQKQRPMAEEATDAKREPPCSSGSLGEAVPMAAAGAAGAESQKARQQRLDVPSGRHATSSLHMTWASGLQQGHMTSNQDLRFPEVGASCRDLTLCACT